jgi:lipoprotein NlpD
MSAVSAASSARALLALLSSLLLAGCGLLSWSDNPQPRRTVSSHRSVSPRPPPGGDYVVQRGDTVYSIAFRSQLDYHDIANWNGIGRDYAIHPGQRLRLSPPPGGSWALPSPATSPVASAPPPATSSGAARPVYSPPPSSTVAVVPPVLEPPSPTPDIEVSRWWWPTRGAIVQRFDPDNGQKGVDIGGDLGQVVVASAPGKVVYSGSALKGYGELVIIKHNEEYLSAYGYNRRRLVEEGQVVTAGQPIAELGLGPEQKPTLHFEIRDKGRPIDPRPLLASR